MTMAESPSNDPLRIEVEEPFRPVRFVVWPRVALIVSGWLAAGTFLVAKDTGQHFNTLQMCWCRIMLSLLIMLPIYLLTRRPGPHLRQRSDWRLFALMGLCGVTVNQVFFLYGIQLAPELDAALLFSFTPLVVLVVAVIWLGERLTGLKVLGIALALVGVVWVLRTRGQQFSLAHFKGDLLLSVAVLAWAGYTLAGKNALRSYDPIAAITWSFAFGALSMLPLTPWVFADFDWRSPGWPGWLGLLYMSLLTSGVAFNLWYWALKRLEASQVAVFSNLQPIWTALLVWLFRGVVPTLSILLGAGLVMGGVMLVQWLPAKSKTIS
ncbi:MAG: hypothetical protein HJJLKODD_01000 [Phycisphaerae bacterium]|nr:hypothetical protein [Phycisphaerae bacterium]